MSRISPRSRRRTPIAAAAAVLSLLATACSSDASTRTVESDGPTTTAGSVTVPATVPDGITLRVGDQLDYLKTVLSLAGEDQDFPYTVEYSAFIGGPPMLQAFQADALDTGFVGSTPLIFAQAGGQEITAVAGWASESGGYSLLKAPGADVADWDDLEGKKVAYQRGTAGEAALLQALDGVGLSLDDVETVDLPTTQVAAALESGAADAGLSVEPLSSVVSLQNPEVTEVARASEITDRSSFVIASAATLGDDGKTAALADYVARLVRAFAYLQDHPEQIAESVYAQQYGLPIDVATRIVERNGALSFIDLPDDIVDAQQRLADLFHAAGQIPVEVDVAAQFDTRFVELVESEQGS